VGTNIGLLLHVLPGPNKQSEAKQSILLSWIWRHNNQPGRLVRTRYSFRKFIFLWFALPIWPDR
jgi:UDP-N-acetyl-D-mannosaminuronic acid transferase (WecB/TagA/CpsF family)